MVGQHGFVAGRQVDDRDLTERRGRGECDRRTAAGHRQPGHDPTSAVDDRAGAATVGGDRPQVGAAAVAETEPHPALALVRQAAGVGGAAGHHVAVQGIGEVGDLAVVDADAVQVGVADRVACPADHEQRRPVGRPVDGGGHPVGEREHARPGVRVVHLQEVHRRAVVQVAVGAFPAGEGECGAVRRPGRGARAVPSVGELPELAARHVEDVHLRADLTEHPLAVGLVVEAVRDHRSPRAAGRVDRRGEREPAAVRAPTRCTGSDRQVRHLLGLASPGVDDGDLPVAEEGEPGAVRGPDGRRVGRTGGQAAGRVAVGGDQPQLVHVAVLVGVRGPEHVGDPAAVR